jgi:hypothetical protein
MVFLSGSSNKWERTAGTFREKEEILNHKYQGSKWFDVLYVAGEWDQETTENGRLISWLIFTNFYFFLDPFLLRFE